MGEAPSSGWRDLLVLVAVFGVILGGLYLYTGVWPPAVIVESGSMMHRDTEVTYGRSWVTFGPATIDPGDLVLVKEAHGRDEVETWAARGRSSYGDYGDVVIYFRGGMRATTPIIHRAMAWVDVEKANGEARYVVHWAPGVPCPSTSKPGAGNTCVFGEEGITIEQIGLYAYEPHRSGLITKGDNPFTNSGPDQTRGISDIVQPEWIQGKARAEIPWLGLLKLSISDSFNEHNCVPHNDRGGFKWFEASPPTKCPGWVALGRAYAPKDLWVMLGASLFVLVGLPVAYDVYRALADRREAAKAAEASLASPGTLGELGAPPADATAPPPSGGEAGGPPDAEGDEPPRSP